MSDIFKKLWTWFKVLPTWIRFVVSLLVAVLISIFSLSSCGQTVRVTVRDTPTGVSISTTQSKKDSSGTNININPNFNL